jgi:hypothetical protein
MRAKAFKSFKWTFFDTQPLEKVESEIELHKVPAGSLIDQGATRLRR